MCAHRKGIGIRDTTRGEQRKEIRYTGEGEENEKGQKENACENGDARDHLPE